MVAARALGVRGPIAPTGLRLFTGSRMMVFKLRGRVRRNQDIVGHLLQTGPGRPEA
jgi:hypothetical protein